MAYSEEEALKVVNAYLEDIKNKRKSALQLQREALRAQSEQQLTSALTERKAQERAANTDYMNYINPYGFTAETGALRGINSSGITQSNAARAYSAYLNRLSSAGSAYSQSKSDILQSADQKAA